MELPGNLTITDLLPHRERMLLISELIGFDETTARAAATVSAQWPLTDATGASPLVLVELAAQTAAINNGWQNRCRNGPGTDRRGWIVGVKSARFYIGRLPLGTRIVIESRNVFELDGFRELKGTVSIEGRLAAEISLQVVQAAPEDPVHAKQESNQPKGNP